MYLQEHQKQTVEKLGNPYTLVHLFLDQFFRSYEVRCGWHNVGYHRHVLHHEDGIALIAALFGEKASEAARIHILADIQVNGIDTIPKSWDDYPEWGILSTTVREKINCDWQRMVKLYQRFTVIILGDTYGGIRKVMKPLLKEADLIIVTGQYWNEQDGTFAHEIGLKRLHTFGVVLCTQGTGEKIDSLQFCDNIFYFHKPTWDNGDDEVKFIITTPGDGESSLEWDDTCLLIRPGYAGFDVRKPLSAIRMDLYGDECQRNGKNISIARLLFDDDLKVWTKQGI